MEGEYLEQVQKEEAHQIVWTYMTWNRRNYTNSYAFVRSIDVSIPLLLYPDFIVLEEAGAEAAIWKE
jgi:hypothetical protein